MNGRIEYTADGVIIADLYVANEKIRIGEVVTLIPHSLRVGPAGPQDEVIGVSRATTVEGEYVPVLVFGFIRLIADDDFQPGDAVRPSTTGGRAQKANPPAHRFGRATTTSKKGKAVRVLIRRIPGEPKD